MTLIRMFSDIHCEFGPFTLETTERDHETILVIAGDFHVGYRGIAYIVDYLCSRFKHVIRVNGNHEFYTSIFQETRDQWNSHGISNLTTLDNSSTIIDDVMFYGGTGWTDLNKSNPRDIFAAKRNMNDYQCIRYIDSGYERILSPDDTIAEHNEFVNNLSAARKNFGGKMIVVSHHAPSYQSIPHRFKNDILNSSFASNLDGIIEDVNAELWIHGHVHDSFDYMRGNTRVICNPRGYVTNSNDLNPEFNNTLTVEV